MTNRLPDAEYDDLHPAVQRMISRRAFLNRGAAGATGLLVFGGLFAVAGCGDDDDADDTPAATQTETQPAKASLYDRLGGEAALTAVVASFLKKVAADKRINAFFANTDLDALRKMVVAQLGEATGGPQKYTGRDMKTAHAGLEIKVADFNAFVEDLVATLDAAKVPKAEQDELLAILGPMQTDIVTA